MTRILILTPDDLIPGRNPERAPTLTDFRGSVEESHMAALVLYRYPSPPGGEREYHVLKNRFGPTPDRRLGQDAVDPLLSNVASRTA